MAIKPTFRKPTTVNNLPSSQKKTYKTAAGAQQYVRGNTSDERRDNAFKVMKAAGRKEPYNSALVSSLSAAQYADESRTIKSIVGPKKAKTDSTVEMYDRFERENTARAKKSLEKKKTKTKG